MKRLALVAAYWMFAASAVCAQERFRGDETLGLASTQWQKADETQAARRLRALLVHLQLEAARAQRYGDFESAKFIKAESFLEIGELSHAVLIARRGAKIGKASNLTVIANGEVEIAFASSVLVVAAGSIRISHEVGRHSGGVYVTRSSVHIAHGNDAVVYARGGAEISNAAAIVAYNTDVKTSYVTVTSHLRGRLFRDEPVRTARSHQPPVTKPEVLNFGGDRCAVGIEIDYLARQLPPMVRREAECARIDSAFVRCEENRGSPPSGSSRERWIFQACGKKVEVLLTSAANLRSIAIDRGPQGPPPLTKHTLTQEDLKRISKLFDEAFAHSIRGELVQAREKYSNVLAIAPDHDPALKNIASLDARLSRADEAAARFTAVIAKGQGTARTYADRGLAYIGAGDMGRGLSELDFAAGIDVADLSIRLDRADAYLRADRLDHSAHLATELIVRNPRLGKAYEIRAWANLLNNRGAEAYKDAFASLAEAPPWTGDSFVREKAAYRVIVGYFALRQTEPREKATDWLQQWRPLMSAGAWPDAYALYVLGRLDEAEVRKIAASYSKNDRGNAVGEAAAFLALDAHFAGDGEAARKRMIETFRTEYSAGYTLGLLIQKLLLTPSRQIRTRQQL